MKRMAVFPIFSPKFTYRVRSVTVEHYYQAQKFVGTADAVLIPVIYAAQTPADAAALGRAQTRQVRLDWEQVKTQVMREAVLKSF